MVTPLETDQLLALVFVDPFFVFFFILGLYINGIRSPVSSQ